MYFNGYKDIFVADIAFDSGKAKGLAAYLVRNGAFECVVVKDHALDIAHASFCGNGVAFVGRNGLSARKDVFTKSFEGGLLYTCGFDSISNCAEGVYTHGTFHGTAAENVSFSVEDGVVVIKGDIPLTGLFVDELIIHRELRVCKCGVTVTDNIENTRGVASDYCVLYHCNFGAPFLEAGGEVKIDYLTREGLTQLAREKECEASLITAPTPAQEENVYYHTVGEGRAEYINARLGIAAKVTYDAKKLPVLLEWKSMAEDDYALGLEPASTRFDTFTKTAIAPRDTYTYSVSIKFEKI